jgi:hypothetical protein
MLCSSVEDSAVDIATPTRATERARCDARTDWRTVDRALRAIRRSRTALDAEEMHWLREADALQIWRPLGMVSALDYLERVLGYSLRAAQDRLRVARALDALPRLTAALADDQLTFCAVRELTRVATPATETGWVAAAVGKSLRDIEQLVADHRPGDRPDDPPDPEARMHVVRFELAAPTFALLRQARQVLDDEHGTRLPDDEFVAALCSAVLDGAPATESTGRARFQIAVTVCRRCRAGWQDAAGAQVALEPAAIDRAMCDAQHIGSIDAPSPERAYQDIAPSVARLVWRRDGGRCRITGCRSARGLEIHHIVHREHGGSHEASNLILACSSCHLAHHRGALEVTGTAEHLDVRRPALAASEADVAGAPSRAGSVAAKRSTGSPPRIAIDDVAPASANFCAPQGATGLSVTTDVAASTMNAPVADPGTHVGAATRLDAAILRTQAKAALMGLGWKPAIAHAAVADAAAAVGAELTLERLIFESLRRCPTTRP